MVVYEDLEDRKRIILRKIVIVMIILFLFIFLLFRVIRFSKISGHSMDNTLYDGELLIVETISIEPKYRDIVIIECKDLSAKFIIKRVIAVEGDVLEIKNNKVYINGKELKESYIKEPMITEDYPKITIPEGKVFVMGDNRNISMDSRSNAIGLVDVEEQIFAEAIFSISKWHDFD